MTSPPWLPHPIPKMPWEAADGHMQTLWGTGTRIMWEFYDEKFYGIRSFPGFLKYLTSNTVPLCQTVWFCSGFCVHFFWTLVFGEVDSYSDTLQSSLPDNKTPPQIGIWAPKRIEGGAPSELFPRSSTGIHQVLQIKEDTQHWDFVAGTQRETLHPTIAATSAWTQMGKEGKQLGCHVGDWVTNSKSLTSIYARINQSPCLDLANG